MGHAETKDWLSQVSRSGFSNKGFSSLPRFFVHKSIRAFADDIVHKHGSPAERAYLFPSHTAALHCANFIRAETGLDSESARIIDLYPNDSEHPIISAVLFQAHLSKFAKSFWQHTGGGVSSRQAEYCHEAFMRCRLSAKCAMDSASMILDASSSSKGPRRYHKESPADGFDSMASTSIPECIGNVSRESHHFVEERFGRNLDKCLAESAKVAVRRRIANALASSAPISSLSRQKVLSHQNHINNLSAPSSDDVYLYSCGMNAIFHAHELLMACRGQKKSISYGYSERAVALC